MARKPVRLLNPVVTLLEDRAVPATVTWTGQAGTGLWSTPGNWDTNKLPASGDDVIIPTVPLVTYDAAAGSTALNTLTVNSGFNLQGGTLTVAGGGLFAQTVNHTGGTLGGTGTLTFQKSVFSTGGTRYLGPGRSIFQANADWTLSTGTNNIIFEGRQFETAATVNWSGAGSLLTNDGSFIVKAGGSFNSSSTGEWQFNTGPSGFGPTPLTIDSGATLNVTAPTFFQGGVNIDGSANFAANVTLVGGGNWTGSVAGTGSVTILAGGITLDGNATVALAGALNLQSGLVLAVSAATDATITRMVQTGGSFGGIGKVTITQSYTWSGGFMTEPGETVFAPTASVTLDSSVNTLGIDGRNVTNKAKTIWSGSKSVFAGGSFWRNKTGSSFEIRGDGIWSNDFTPGGPHAFIIEEGASLLRTTSTDTATFLIPVFNNGLINVGTGILNLAGGLNGGPSSLANGSYALTGQLRAPGLAIVNNTATITLNGPAAAFINSTTNNNAAANLSSNAGKITLSGNATFTINNLFVNSGSFSVDVGTKLNLAGPYTQTAGVTVVNGAIDPGGAPGNVFVNGGTLQGNGAILGNLRVNTGAVSPGNSPGRIQVFGEYFQLDTLIIGLDGPVAGTDYDQIQATDTVTLGGPLLLFRSIDPTVGQQFTIIDNQSLVPVVGEFDDLPQGESINVSGMRFKINYFGGDGNDVVLTRIATGISKIEPGDPGQCSVVRQITVTFNGLVTLPGIPANAFTLQKTNGAPTGSVSMTVNTVDSFTETTATISFPGGPFTDGGGLADGKYLLTTLGNQITDPSGAFLDGAGTGTPGSNGAVNFNRLYGDINCDGIVDNVDFLQFRLSFLTSNTGFDIEGDGTVDNLDFLRFRLNFLKTLPP